MHRLRVLAFLLVPLLSLVGCTTSETGLPLAAAVDLSRYAGRWYIIANIPYFAERGKVGSYFDVSFPDGNVRDVYTGRDRDFSAEPRSSVLNGYVVADTGNAYWRETPFWPIYLSYLILYLDADYQTALVGYPGKGYGWVLARSPDMDEASYQALIGRFAALGYDTTQFRRVPQKPEQLGRAGFQ